MVMVTEVTLLLYLFNLLETPITLEVVEDGSISCVSSGYTPITFIVSCATCVNPQVDYEIVSDCLNAPQFFVDVNITDMGSAGSLTIVDNQGNSSSATGNWNNTTWTLCQ